MFADISSLWDSDCDIDDSSSEEYRTVITKHVENNKLLLDEAYMIISCNFSNRASVFCKCLMAHKRGFSWDNMVFPDTGNSFLHTALLYKKTEVSLMLIKDCGKDLVLTKNQSELFKNMTSLHVAAVNGDFQSASAILELLNDKEKHTLLSAQLTSNFTDNNLDLSGCTLSLSIWGGSLDIFDLLVNNGAVLDGKDNRNGDTVIHTLILKASFHKAGNQVKVLNHILKSDASLNWWSKKNNTTIQKCGTTARAHMIKYLLKIKNGAGYTPLTYATLLGAQHILSYILRIEMVNRFKNWQYGGVTMSCYDMSEIEPSCTQVNEPSAIDLLAYAHEGDKLDILGEEPIKTVMNKKWQSAFKLYIFWGVLHVITMVVLTVVALHRKTKTMDDDPKLSFSELHEDGRKYVFVGEIFVAVISVVYLSPIFFQLGRLIYLAFKSRICRDPDFYVAPWSVIFTGDTFWLVMHSFNISFLTYLAMHITRTSGEEVPLGLALLFGWYFILYFTRGFKSTGFFTVMLHRMLFGDLARFAVVFAVFLLAFGSAFVVLFQGPPDGVPNNAKSLRHSLIAHFRLLLGLQDFTDLDESSDPPLAYILYLCFILLASIELLNMLIAAMSDTYAAVSEHEMNVWQHERLKAILMMERNIPVSLWRLLVKVPVFYSEKHDLWLMSVYEMHDNCENTEDS